MSQTCEYKCPSCETLTQIEPPGEKHPAVAVRCAKCAAVFHVYKCPFCGTPWGIGSCGTGTAVNIKCRRCSQEFQFRAPMPAMPDVAQVSEATMATEIKKSGSDGPTSPDAPRQPEAKQE